MIKLEQHEAGKIFPRLDPEARESLKQSIRTYGLLNHIWIYEGKVLSGWERYLICLELGIEPQFRTFENTTITAEDFVWAENAERRHLNKSQLAACAVLYKKLIEDKVKDKRYKAMAETRKNGSGQKSKEISNTSSYIAGQMFWVTRESVIKAQKVHRENPDLFERLRAGNISISEAYEQVTPGFREKARKHEEKYALKILQKRVENTDALPLSSARPTSLPTPIAKRGGVIGNSIRDVRAQKINDEIELSEYKGPPTVYASDHEVWLFDKFLRNKGWSLSLVRIGDNFSARYVKNYHEKLDGYCNNYKQAIISAGKEALAKEEMELKNQTQFNL